MKGYVGSQIPLTCEAAVPDAVWTEGDTTYTLTGLRDVGRAVSARAEGLAGQLATRARGADAALAELQGPVAPVLHDQATRSIAALATLVGLLRQAAATCAAFPDAAPAAAPGEPVPVGPVVSDGSVGGSPPALRGFAASSAAWDDEVRRAAAAVSLEDVTLTKVVRVERPGPVPVPAPPPGTPDPPPVVTALPPETVDPRTMITLPEVSDEAATVTALSGAAAELAEVAAAAFAAADRGGFGAWWARLRLQAVLGDVRATHGLDQADLARELQELWLARAQLRSGIDVGAWDPAAGADANRDTIIAVYEYYGQLNLENPELLWAGMANMIGPSFAAGFFDLAAIRGMAEDVQGWLDDLPGPVRAALPAEVIALGGLADLTEEEVRFYETTFLQMQQDIYVDQAVMHEAYLAGGLPAIEELRASGLIDQRTYDGWADIHDGAASGDQDAIERGNGALLYREQHDIIAQAYDDMYGRFPTGPAFTYAMTVVGAPSIPGASAFGQHRPIEVTVETPGPEDVGTPDRVGIPGTPVGVDIPHVSVDNPLQGSVTVTTPFPDGNIADRDDRWDLITGDTLPAYLDLVRNDPDRVREIVRSSVEGRIDDNRLDEQVDDIVGRLLEWEVDIDQ